MSRHRGFTLMELLVVISIIALLISILMPALKKAREQARVVLCASQTRQTTTALLLYSQDSDGGFPIVEWGQGSAFYDTAGGTAPIRHYFGQGQPNTGSDHAGALKVLLCPSQGAIEQGYVNYSANIIGTTYRIAAGHGNWAGGSAWYGWAPQSHRWPPASYAGGDYGTPIPNINLAGQEADQPSEQPTLVDGWGDAGTWTAFGARWFSDYATNLLPNNHPDGVNAAFADGHAQWTAQSDFQRGYRLWATDWTRW